MKSENRAPADAISAALDRDEAPVELERLYRRAPAAFAEGLPAALAERPDDVCLRVWEQRLLDDAALFGEPGGAGAKAATQGLWLAVILSLVAGSLMKLPAWFPGLDWEPFIGSNAAAIVIGALGLYLGLRRRGPSQHPAWSPPVLLGLAAVFLAAVGYLNLLPAQPMPDAALLARIFTALVFWSLVGVVFAGSDWRSTDARLDYLRYNGELAVYTAMILLGGMLLTALTLALFDLLLDLDIGDWYLEYVVVYGITAAPIVGALLLGPSAANSGARRFAPMLARTFVPLFLVTVVALLLAMLVRQQSPFTDRGALITLNALLLLVLALAIFTLTERRGATASTLSDRLNLALIAVTLILDLIALAAILFRLGTYGMTPNRLAVLGTNLLVFGHLAGILRYQAPLVMAWRRSDAAGQGMLPLNTWIAGYLPLYTAWAVLVAATFPAIFRA